MRLIQAFRLHVAKSCFTCDYLYLMVHGTFVSTNSTTLNKELLVEIQT